ncbi:MAG: OstA family protein [Erythrobacter sp.]|jgi:lipopolysaccharide export system protein LptA|nr:OstA family protein [Erythrobacter sp.]RZV34471.1 MAG: OstA family protein [Sphingomonadaceae bacterium]
MKLSSTRALQRFVIAFAATCAIAGGIQLHAQAISGHNSRAPINVDAGRFEIQDRQDRAVFSGGVVVQQAGLTVRADRVTLLYSSTAGVDINRIVASGGVTVTRGSERAQGNTAIYDLNRRIITMVGNVRLNQSANRLSGGRLVIDLNSGVSSVDGGSSASPGTSESGGRVRGTFTVPQD